LKRGDGIFVEDLIRKVKFWNTKLNRSRLGGLNTKADIENLA